MATKHFGASVDSRHRRRTETDATMKTKAPEIIRDALVLTGAISVVVGLWLISRPFAFVVGGLLLAGIGVAWELDIQRRKAEAEKDRRRGL
jgi:hypothetical protein